MDDGCSVFCCGADLVFLLLIKPLLNKKAYVSMSAYSEVRLYSSTGALTFLNDLNSEIAITETINGR